MATRKSTFTDKKTGSVDLKLLAQVPLDVFRTAVAKSGIPTVQARELCIQFQALKK